MAADKRFYVTTPIYYVNANPHIGHTYTTIAADILARYHRMIGDKVFFSTGTDEHGAKIQEKAKEVEEDPKNFVDKVAARFQVVWDEMAISNNGFIRTTQEDHIKAVQKALQYMYDRGDIYLGKYEGLYCQDCEQYKNESDLINGQCPDHKVEPERMSEETYLFKMSQYADTLRKKIENDELKIRPEEKKNEILSFYNNEGLQDISFSRRNVSWGIPLPWDENHTAYVWADAFLNYLTVLGWSGDPAQAPDFWPAQAHLMSKDILRVHATIWPAMLLSLGLDLPEEIFVHGFFLVDGQKMSKSLGNIITPQDLRHRYGVDGSRYLLMQATVFGYDGDISWDKFDERFNAYLANGLGNLVSRVLSLTEKNFEGCIPETDISVAGETKMVTEEDGEGVAFTEEFQRVLKDYNSQMENKSLDGAIEDINSLVGACDKHISAIKLWEKVKNEPEEAQVHIYALLETIRKIAWLIYPFMPEATDNIFTKLGLDTGQEMQKEFGEAMEWGGLQSGQKVDKGKPLFPRLQD